MRLKIEHTTTFNYDQPISEAYTEMRLKPLNGYGQHCLAFNLTTEPHDEQLDYVDRFGNNVSHFDVIQPHNRLVVAARSEVMTPEQFLQPSAALAPLDEFDYLQGTDYAPLDEVIAGFAASAGADTDSRGTALALMSLIYGTLNYEQGATDVSTTAAEALALGRGVCQDFSHLMLAACRSRGIPARYVSGYLYNDGQSTASHAWVDVFIQGQGWLSLDPTHNREQTGEYVRVAIGRDYADVPPTLGIFVGNARESMEVKVTVNLL